MTIYNKIGDGYNSTRMPDPYIASRLHALLSPKPDGLYLDIGCGTGNYLKALSDMGMNFYGVDPSEVMLCRAKEKNTNATLIQAKAENIPLADSMFDSVMAILTIHHWSDILTGLKEVNRIMKQDAKLVFFSYTPEQMTGYWLYHYFPQMIERSLLTIPDARHMEELLNNSGFKLAGAEKYCVAEDLQDQFLYSNKYRPEKYLSAEIRNNISSFSIHSDPEEVQNGIAALKEDIMSGAIQTIINDYKNDLGDYLFLVAEKQTISS
jgi:ubiquinone/menaquinone biosynthesis C-methylase UbiE